MQKRKENSQTTIVDSNEHAIFVAVSASKNIKNTSKNKCQNMKTFLSTWKLPSGIFWIQKQTMKTFLLNIDQRMENSDKASFVCVSEQPNENSTFSNEKLRLGHDSALWANALAFPCFASIQDTKITSITIILLHLMQQGSKDQQEFPNDLSKNWLGDTRQFPSSTRFDLLDCIGV